MIERRKHTFSEEDGVSLKEYMLAQCKAHTEATKLAREALEKRLDGMNEIREQLKAQNQTFVTRNEHEFLAREIQDLKESRAELRGKANQSSVYIAYVFSVIAIIISLLHLLR
jgi:hypothetical protein